MKLTAIHYGFFLAAAALTACASVTAEGDAAMLAPPAVAATPPPDWQAIRIFAQLTAVIELPFAPGPIDDAIRWQLTARDRIHDLEGGFAAFIDHASLVMPDLTVLTTEPVAHTESSGFGWRDDPIRHNRSFHAGTDFSGKPGTPVMAAGPGVVVFCGRMGGYGNMIEIDHGGGIVTRYAHLRKIETTKGSAVSAGDQIGLVGSTGRTTGPHLHFEVRLEGAPVSPVVAMSIAALQRTDPIAGRLAALSLTPELQASSQSDIDPPRKRAKPVQRPERPGRGKRSQVLW